MTAVGNMFRKIGLTYKLRGNLQFNEFLSKRDAKEMTGPFRLAWVMDYPVDRELPGPAVRHRRTGPGRINTTFYSSPAFDAALAAGDRAPTIRGRRCRLREGRERSGAGSAGRAAVQRPGPGGLGTHRVSGVRYSILGEIVLADIVVDWRGRCDPVDPAS